MDHYGVVLLTQCRRGNVHAWCKPSLPLLLSLLLLMLHGFDRLEEVSQVDFGVFALLLLLYGVETARLVPVGCRGVARRVAAERRGRREGAAAGIQQRSARRICDQVGELGEGEGRGAGGGYAVAGALRRRRAAEVVGKGRCWRPVEGGWAEGRRARNECYLVAFTRAVASIHSGLARCCRSFRGFCSCGVPVGLAAVAFASNVSKSRFGDEALFVICLLL